MKIKAMFLGCLICAVALFIGYEYSWAGSKVDIPASKIGVVSIWKIFQDCRRNAKYMEEAVAEERKVEAELDKLAKEVEADKAGLKTLKAGSSEHIALMKEMLEKDAKYQAQTKFHERQIELKVKRWTEELYKEILQITGEIAEQKGLDLVLERSEPELPALSANELALAIRTHKLLYSGGCLDITDEVISRLDVEESEEGKTKGAKP